MDAIEQGAWRARIERIRNMTPEERFMACMRLTDEMFETVRTRIRAHFPEMPEYAVSQVANAYWDRVRRMDG
jgi:hypothetical protein